MQSCKLTKAIRLHKVSLTKTLRVIKCWDCQFLLALAFTMQNAGDTIIPNRCSLLIKRELNKESIFQEEESSSFSGFCANVAKQTIVYCEFNCQTGEVTHKKFFGASTSRSTR